MKTGSNHIIKRLPSYPLMTVDPYFSIWSPADKLYDKHTVNWTGIENQMSGFIKVDGEVRRFLGQERPFDADSLYRIACPNISTAMLQTNVECNPMCTVYTFEGLGIELTASFFTPLFLDKPDILSRPVSYIRLEVKPIDSQEHDIELYFDISAQICRENSTQAVEYRQGRLDNGDQYVSIGRKEQPVLEKAGDHLMIDWGRLYISGEGKCFAANGEQRFHFIKNEDVKAPFDGDSEDVMPVIAATVSAGKINKEFTTYITAAYDDIYSIEYFGEKLKAYCYKDGETFMDILNKAVQEKEKIYNACVEFDKAFLAEYDISDSYRELLKVSYRQAIAAHKTISYNNTLLFLSKECHSNGCIGTVDVSYPSIPLFLIYNPELVKGMIRPIFRYARTDEWSYEFAPHDVGIYPKANGQKYGENKREYQMPVEECGNMLIITYAASYYSKDYSLACENLDLLKQWADYLVENGYCPENQLCTDDFAGHLEKNANLSVKALVGIACFGRMLNELGQDGKHYCDIAKEYARKWESELVEDDHTLLAFDMPGTWSIKYNMVWDRIFGLNLFSNSVIQQDIKYYLKQQQSYGIPLDYRKPYTKADWELWAAAMADDDNDFETIVKLVIAFLNETPDRVPFADWYTVAERSNMMFQNRTVIGGLFIKILYSLH